MSAMASIGDPVAAFQIEDMPQLRVSTSPRLVVIKSEPFVVATRRGYQAAVLVEEVQEGKEYLLYVSAVSLTEPLEKFRKARGFLSGCELLIRKESDDRMSKYLVEIKSL
jgi:hypothetical protein